MSSNAPKGGADRPPEGTLQRILPLVLMGISLMLVFQLFPQFFGRGGQPAAPTPSESVAAAASPTPVHAPDTSTRTQIWNTYLVGPLQTGLRFLATDLGLGAGTAIILFTIGIRALMLPLSIQQIRSQKSMQKLQPELKALQKRLGKDKEKLSVETMALYKEHGVNPAAGCFPIVIQMPVLFALYGALNGLGSQNLPENEPFHQPWLWIEHLNRPDVIHLGGIALPFILPILAAITQWVQQRMMTQPTQDPQQQMQNQIFQFMPLMMLWFGLSVSSGLALYWVTQNVIAIVQQYFSTGLGSLAPLVARVRGMATPAPPARTPVGRAAEVNGAPRDRGSDRTDGRGRDNRSATGRRTRGKR